MNYRLYDDLTPQVARTLDDGLLFRILETHRRALQLLSPPVTERTVGLCGAVRERMTIVAREIDRRRGVQGPHQ